MADKSRHQVPLFNSNNQPASLGSSLQLHDSQQQNGNTELTIEPPARFHSNSNEVPPSHRFRVKIPEQVSPCLCIHCHSLPEARELLLCPGLPADSLLLPHHTLLCPLSTSSEMCGCVECSNTPIYTWNKPSAHLMLCIHGLGLGGMSFAPLALANKDLYFVAMDLRGHGKSTTPIHKTDNTCNTCISICVCGLRFKNLILDVLECIIWLKYREYKPNEIIPKSITIVGHSLGGCLAVAVTQVLYAIQMNTVAHIDTSNTTVLETVELMKTRLTDIINSGQCRYGNATASTSNNSNDSRIDAMTSNNSTTPLLSPSLLLQVRGVVAIACTETPLKVLVPNEHNYNTNHNIAVNNSNSNNINATLPIIPHLTHRAGPFNDIQQAIQYLTMLRLTENPLSASVVVPIQLQLIPPTPPDSTSSSKLKGSLLSRAHTSPSSVDGSGVDLPSHQLHWRVSVSNTLHLCSQWFHNYSQSLISLPGSKLLIVPSYDHVDGPLITAHMQGKVQISTVSGGHSIHEDKPGLCSDAIVKFLQRLATPMIIKR